MYTTGYPQKFDAIWDYNAYWNSIRLDCDSMKHQGCILLLNGKLVYSAQAPYGYVYFNDRNGNEDSAFFIVWNDVMYINKDLYKKMMESFYKNQTCETYKYEIGPCDTAKIRLSIYDFIEEKYYDYVGKFPKQYLFPEREFFDFRIVFKITTDKKNKNYIMSLIPHNRYRYYHIDGPNKGWRKTRLLKKHLKYYGYYS